MLITCFFIKTFTKVNQIIFKLKEPKSVKKMQASLYEASRQCMDATKSFFSREKISHQIAGLKMKNILHFCFSFLMNCARHSKLADSYSCFSTSLTLILWFGLQKNHSAKIHVSTLYPEFYRLPDRNNFIFQLAN